MLSNSSLHNPHITSVVEKGGVQLKSKSSSEQQLGCVCLEMPGGLSPRCHSMFLNHSGAAGVQHTPGNVANWWTKPVNT